MKSHKIIFYEELLVTLKTRYRFLIGILVLFVVGLICRLIFLRNEKFTLDELRTLDNVDKITIFHKDTDEDSLVKTIKDSQEVSSVVEVFRNYADGWQYPSFQPYARSGPLRVNFYDGEKQRLVITIGSYTNDTKFYLSILFGPAKFLEENEFKELMSILKVDESLAKEE